MRIWAFPSFYPYDVPGEKWKGIFVHRQYKGLIENGADLKVIIPVMWKPIYPISQLKHQWRKYKVSYPKSRVYDGIQIYHPRVANLLPYALDKRSYNEKHCDAITDFFKDQNIKLDPKTDIFFSQWLPEAIFVQNAAHKLGVKSAILSIGDDVVVLPEKSKESLLAFDKLMTEADMRFACADYLGKETNRILGKDLSYDVVNWGVDYNFFKPASADAKVKLREKYGLPQDKLLILNVGSSIVRKGWLDLFDALKDVRAKVDNFGIIAVHAGEVQIDLDEEAAKRGLGDIFFNLHEIPPQQLNEVFNAVDIFCLPSHWEGLANANIEAMSSGLPVVTTNVCGHPELVTDGVNGILVPPKSVKILSEKLFALLTDGELRNKLGKNGREFIVNKWGNFADNAQLLYRKLTGK